MWRILPLLFVAYGLATPTVYAQLASIEGFIKDAETGRLLLNANIMVRETRRGIATDTTGFFAINNIKPGRYTLVCSYMGYQVWEERVTLERGESLNLDVKLRPANVAMREIIVQPENNSSTLKHIGRQQLSTELITHMPVFEADVFQSVQFLPGVQSSSDFSSNLYIRGGNPGQTLVLFDSNTIYKPTHFFGFFSAFNTDVIRSVNLYKGAYPATYGDRLGSVLKIDSKTGNSNRLGGSLTAGMLASRLMVEGPAGKKASWYLAARRSTIGPVLDMLRNSTSGIPEDYHFYDLNGKFDLVPSLKNRFSLSLYAGEDKILFPVTEQASLTMNYGNQSARASWEHLYSPTFSSQFSISGTHYFNTSGYSIAGFTHGRFNEIYELHAEGEIDSQPASWLQVSAGAKFGVTRLSLGDKALKNGTFSKNIENKLVTAYVHQVWELSDSWQVKPGLRFNYAMHGAYLRLDPRFSIQYAPGSRFSIHASYGRYHQFLSLIANEAFAGFDMWLSTSENIPPSKAHQFALGINTIPLKAVSFDLEVYFKRMDGLFELNPFRSNWAGLAYDDLLRTGEGYSYGVEAILEKKAGFITGYIGYALGYAWQKFPGFNRGVVNQSGTERYYPPKYDRRHDLTFILNFQLSPQWKITSAFSYASGQAFTKALGRYAVNNSPFNPGARNVLTVGRVNAERLPAYHRLDISVSKTGTFLGQAETEIQLYVLNVYSRRNIWFYNYYFEENPVRQIEVTLLPVLPALSYSIKF